MSKQEGMIMKNNLTLVELLMTLVLIGILLMVIVPVQDKTVTLMSNPNSKIYVVQVTEQPESEVNVE